jgi:hypothetical protein
MKKFLLAFLGLCILLTAAWFGVRAFEKSAILVTHPTRGPAVLAVYATGTVEATVMLFSRALRMTICKRGCANLKFKKNSPAKTMSARRRF